MGVLMMVRFWLYSLIVVLITAGAALAVPLGSTAGRANDGAPPPIRLAMGVVPQGGPLLLVGTVFRDCTDCPELVVMPLGNVTMGAASGEEEAEGVLPRFRGRAGPQHNSAITEALAVGRYEVTVGEFSRFVLATGRKMHGCWLSVNREWKLLEERSWRMPGYGQIDRDPVVCVSWDDAKAYVDWLSGALKQKYRLLTEAEWEYVARSGTTAARPWGAGIGRNFTNCIGCGSRWDGQRPAPVGSFSVNRFGLYDLLGNVAEWVEDCWHDSYDGAPNDGSAWTSGSCEFRVIRGGSWVDHQRNVRSAQRDRDTPQMRSAFLGFRIARTITP